MTLDSLQSHLSLEEREEGEVVPVFNELVFAFIAEAVVAVVTEECEDLNEIKPCIKIYQTYSGMGP